MSQTCAGTAQTLKAVGSVSPENVSDLSRLQSPAGGTLYELFSRIYGHLLSEGRAICRLPKALSLELLGSPTSVSLGRDE